MSAAYIYDIFIRSISIFPFLPYLFLYLVAKNPASILYNPKGFMNFFIPTFLSIIALNTVKKGEMFLDKARKFEKM